MKSIALLPLAAAEHALHQFDALRRHGAVLQEFEDGRRNVRSSAKDLLDGTDVRQRGRHRFFNQVSVMRGFVFETLFLMKYVCVLPSRSLMLMRWLVSSARSMNCRTRPSHCFCCSTKFFVASFGFFHLVHLLLARLPPLARLVTRPLIVGCSG